MSATRTFGEQLDALGIWWPQGDGDALREAAAAWTAMADLLADITTVLDAAARSVVEHHHGDAANRFGELWQHWSSDSGYLATTVADCRRLAAALTGFGTDVDVADRTLAHFVEQALEAMSTAIAPGAIDVWMTWLHDVAAGIGEDLSLRATHHATPLGDIQPSRQPRLPTDPDRVAIDPARITWPDPGKPIDLTNVMTTVVDFGAGQGTLPPALTPPVKVPDPIISGPPTPVTADPIGTTPPPIVQPPGTAPPATTSIVVNGNGTTINVNVGAANAAIPIARVPPPIPTTPPLPTVPDVVPATSPNSSASSDWTSGLNGLGAADIALPSIAEMPVISAPPPAVPTRPAPVPISIDPPGAASAATAVAAVAAVAATGVAAKVAGGSAKPFLPFMPMGGGGAGGDEGVEPKRRVTRR